MSPRRARRRPRWFHHQDAYIYNGYYQQKFVEAPVVTWAALARIAVRYVLLGVLFTASALLVALLFTAALLTFFGGTP